MGMSQGIDGYGLFLNDVAQVRMSAFALLGISRFSVILPFDEM